MLPIAGQTAGKNRLKLFVDTHGWTKYFLFFFQFFFHGQRWALHLVINDIIQIVPRV